LVCWEAGTSFQPSDIIGKLDLSVLVNTLARGQHENLVHCLCCKGLVKEEEKPVGSSGKLLFTHTVARYRNIVVFLLVSPSHLNISCMVSSSSSTAKPEDSSTGRK